MDRHARLVLHRLRDRRRAGVRPPRAALLGPGGGPPSPSRPVVAAGRRGGDRGPARLVPGEPGPVVVLGAPRLVAVRDDDRLDARGRGGRARRTVAARRAWPVRRDLHGHAVAARRGRDGRLAVAARRPVRAVAAGQRPLLRHRQRRARRLLRQRPRRRRVARGHRDENEAGPGRGGGRAACRGRLRLAGVRREGRRDDRARALPAAAGRVAGRGAGAPPVGGSPRGQRAGPVPRVRAGQLLPPGGRRVRPGDVRRATCCMAGAAICSSGRSAPTWDRSR